MVFKDKRPTVVEFVEMPILIAVGLSIVLLGLVFVIGLVVDFIGIVPTETTVVTVEHKQVVPASISMMATEKDVAIRYQEESYKLHFKIGDKKFSLDVGKRLFNNVSVGDEIRVDYGLGRISGYCYPIRIRESESN